MKVYTEVNYIWKDDKLIQTDSKSFDYEGEVDQCHTRKTYLGINIPHGHGGSLEQTGKNITEGWESGGKVLTENTREEWKKPGGDVKRFTDWGAKLDHEAQMIAWGHSSYEDKGGSADDDPESYFKGSKRGLQGKGKDERRKSEDMRRTPYAMSTGTLLTPGQKAKKVGPR
jgi:hypothetical protein|tara:strand:+ start:669 stop:1181 length:513 start_codon:yes stop_codon:yes gene_type:complete